tara:strand:- start:366 stop:578 length:213 start_codon:yes stop_codon:yes gene_type:complete
MPARASGQYGHQLSVKISPTTIICSADAKDTINIKDENINVAFEIILIPQFYCISTNMLFLKTNFLFRVS